MDMMLRMQAAYDATQMLRNAAAIRSSDMSQLEYGVGEAEAMASVRLHFHTWRKFVHPCRWETHHGN